MDRPKPQSSAPAPGYPSLEEFCRDRRRLLQHLAVGAAGLAVAPLVSSCLTERRQGARDPQPGADLGGSDGDLGQPPGKDLGQSEPDLGGDEPPSPGGEAQPPLFELRLPEQGGFECYVAEGSDLLSFALLLSTESEAFFLFCRDQPMSPLAAAAQVFADLSCAELQSPEQQAGLEQRLRTALGDMWAERSGAGAGLFSATFEVVSCDANVGLGGDAPSPDYPGEP